MNISLTPELEAFVQKQVESGLYHSQSEVIREGLRLLKRFNDHSEEYKPTFRTSFCSIYTDNKSFYRIYVEKLKIFNN